MITEVNSPVQIGTVIDFPQGKAGLEAKLARSETSHCRWCRRPRFCMQLRSLQGRKSGFGQGRNSAMHPTWIGQQQSRKVDHRSGGTNGQANCAVVGFDKKSLSSRILKKKITHRFL